MPIRKPPEPPEITQAWQRMGPVLRGAWGWSLVCGVLTLSPVAYMFQVYGEVVQTRSLSSLGMLFLALVWALLVLELLDWLRARLLRHAGALLESALGERVFQATLQAQLLRGQPGWGQPLQDIRMVREACDSPWVHALMDLPLVLLFLGFLFLIHPWLALAALACVLLQAVLGGWIFWNLVPALDAASEQLQGGERLSRSMHAQPDAVLGMGMLADLASRWAPLRRQALGDSLRATSHSLGLAASARSLQMLLSSVLLGLSAWLLMRNELGGGSAMMIVSSTLGARVLAPFSQLMLHGRAWAQARAALQRLRQLLHQVPPVPAAMPLPAPRGRLALEGISAAAAGGSPMLLRGIHLTLEPGQCVVVVGASGSGKSTLARVALGLWPVAAGAVRLDGADLALWPKQALGPWLGYVSQHYEVGQGTVWEHLTRWDGTPLSRLSEVLARLPEGWLGFVESLPEGWQTRLGPAGEPLSLGQRQRLAIARAFHGNPCLVVLDEPHSALDEAGETALLAWLAREKQAGRTLVLITHQVGWLDLADQLLWLDRGAVRAVGPREQVLSRLKGEAPS